MMVAMTAMLVSVAELSNIFSVFVVLICLCGMVLFIMRNMMVFRVHGEDMMFGSSVHPVPPRIPQVKMMKVHIPFTFKLVESSKSSYSDVQCSVSSQVPYTLLALWGVSIRELHLFLWRPWSAVREAARRGQLLHGHYQQAGTVLHSSAGHDEQCVSLSLPRPVSPATTLDLGTPPRLCYPLVVFLVRNDDVEGLEGRGHHRELHPDESVALVNVVHIKDSVCTLPTSILAQYLKQANGQLSCLKQLYLATGNTMTSYDDETSPLDTAFCPNGLAGGLQRAHGLSLGQPGDGDGCGVRAALLCEEQLCVVCQFYPLSRALLPCRHTCVCAGCFNRLDRCPMCRSPIKSYFCIRGEEYMPLETGNSTKAAPPTPLAQWLQDWNDRLTDFLGFHR
ncbi:cell growth regulator with RING finger domain protein 1 [Frankliniella occidentalis]|uniref:Cell growth regulator with RING finger domain protein 1 n=1 Tax=Frankliniella occidentalis TaxID=133901 RepID=A0A6J1THX0_FRAOC|nr:cell growth regulator with RING finger domain protein 1 [Frankliniella occidentalis]